MIRRSLRFIALRFVSDDVVDVFAQLRDEALLHVAVDLGLALGHLLDVGEARHFRLHRLCTGVEGGGRNREEQGKEDREGRRGEGGRGEEEGKE